MHISIIGGGFIGTILAGAFQRGGHDVVIGSRKSRSRPDAIPVAAPEETLAAADVVVLAQPGSAVEDFLREHGDALAGKLIVDATNDFDAGTAHHADAAARLVPQARYARAFNSYGGEVFAEPAFGTETSDLFYVSEEADRDTVELLVRAVGANPVYLGPRAHDVLDGVTRLWFALAVDRRHGRHCALRVLTD